MNPHTKTTDSKPPAPTLGRRYPAKAPARLAQVALTAASYGIVITDRDGTILWVNPAFCSMTGYSLREAVGHNPRELVHSGVQAHAVYERMWRTLLSGRVWRGELVNRRKDGSLYTEEQTIVPVRNTLGEIIHFIGIKHDISEREEALEQAHRAEERYRQIFENSLEGIFQSTPEGNFLTANPALARIFGYETAEEFIRDRTDIARQCYANPEDRKKFQQRIESEGALAGFEYAARRRDGSIVWVRENARAVRDAGGRVVCYEGTLEDITDRKQAAQALENSLSLVHATLESTADGLLVVDREGGIVQYNRKFAELWRIPESLLARHNDGEAIGYVLGQLKDPDKFVAKVRELYGQPDAVSFDVVEFKDGRVFERYSQPQRVEGKSVGRVWSFRDVTERRQAETALRWSEERHRLLFEHAPDIMVSVAAFGAIAALNPAFETITGWPREKWIGRHFLDLVHADDKERARDLFRELLRRGKSLTFELRLGTATGGYRDVEFTGFTSRHRGADLEVQGIGRDVTERKEAERLLREQNDILSNSREGVMIVNLDDRVSLWNRGSERIFGWPAADVLGRRPEDVLGDDFHDSLPIIRTAIERDGYWAGELSVHARDGRRLMVECRTTLVRDEAGRPRARLSLIADVTDKKLLEDKFLHAQRLESIGMLAAGIAHDLNNVLAPIVFASPMLRAALTNPRELKILDTLANSATRGTGLVRQILGFARGASGEAHPTQVKHIAREIAGLVQETFPKGIEFEQEIPSDLKLVQGNPTQLNQVLLNLCVNARDAMPNGGILRLAAENRHLSAEEAAAIPGARPGNWLVIEVSDTGTGIPPEVLEHIWEPFFTTKGPEKGTGLGLSTVHGIVAAHHGFIDLQTEVGRGTTIRVYLPALDTEETRPPGEWGAGPPRGNGELIAVAEDDPAIRDVVTMALDKHGYNVVAFGDGIDAINYFQGHADEISLVLTDVNMPRMGGAELARALLLCRPDIKLIAMSGQLGEEAARPVLEEVSRLAHGFLRKPFELERLLLKVHEMLHPPAPPPAAG